MSFKNILASAALVCTAGVSTAAFAQGDIRFPSGTNFISGVVRWDENEGAYRCKIKCGGFANRETVVAYRFQFNDGSGRLVTPGWIADGGTIVCNPFNSFNVGFSYGQQQQPATCEVGLD